MHGRIHVVGHAGVAGHAFLIPHHGKGVHVAGSTVIPHKAVRGVEWPGGPKGIVRQGRRPGELRRIFADQRRARQDQEEREDHAHEGPRRSAAGKAPELEGLLELGPEGTLFPAVRGRAELDGKVKVRRGLDAGQATGAQIDAIADGELGAAGSPTIHKGGAFPDHPQVELPPIGGELAEAEGQVAVRELKSLVRGPAQGKHLPVVGPFLGLASGGVKRSDQ